MHIHQQILIDLATACFNFTDKVGKLSCAAMSCNHCDDMCILQDQIMHVKKLHSYTMAMKPQAALSHTALCTIQYTRNLCMMAYVESWP